jgi:hypothetical protein
MNTILLLSSGSFGVLSFLSISVSLLDLVHIFFNRQF